MKQYLYICLILIGWSSLLYSQQSTSFENGVIKKSVLRPNYVSTDELLNNSFPTGDRVTLKETGAEYIIQSDSIAGYAVDTIAVIPTFDSYAVINVNSVIKASDFGIISNKEISDPFLDHSEKINNMLLFLKLKNETINNGLSNVYLANTYSSGFTILFDYGTYFLTNPVNLISGVSFQGTGISTRFEIRFSSLQHHAFGVDTSAIDNQRDHFKDIKIKDCMIYNYQSKGTYTTTRLGYNPYALHGIFLENCSHSQIENVYMEGFINGTAVSFGYAIDETDACTGISATCDTNTISFNRVSSLEKAAAVSPSLSYGWTYNSLVKAIMERGEISALGECWTNSITNCTFNNNYLDIWNRNNSSPLVVSGGEFRNSGDWGTDGSGSSLTSDKQYCVYSLPILNIYGSHFQGPEADSGYVKCTTNSSIQGCYVETSQALTFFIKLLQGSSGGKGSFLGNAVGSNRTFDLSDPSWNFDGRYGLQTIETLPDMIQGNPKRIKVFGNTEFYAGLSNWLFSTNDIINARYGSFTSWANSATTKGVKSVITRDSFNNSPVLVMERLSTGTGQDAIIQHTEDFGKMNEVVLKPANNPVIAIALVKKIASSGGDIGKINIGGAQLYPYVKYPDGWELQIGKLPADGDEAYDFLRITMFEYGNTVGNFSDIGDSLLIRNIQFYQDGFPIYPEINYNSESYGIPPGLNYADFDENYPYHVQDVKYQKGDIIKAPVNSYLNRNESIEASDTTSMGWKCTQSGFGYRSIYSVDTTYYEGDLINNAGIVYLAIDSSLNKSPVDSITYWKSLGTAAIWHKIEENKPLLRYSNVVNNRANIYILTSSTANIESATNTIMYLINESGGVVTLTDLNSATFDDNTLDAGERVTFIYSKNGNHWYKL